MSEIERVTMELRAEADIDFLSLDLIAESLREEFGLTNDGDIRRHTLDVIQRLMVLGVYPGDYTLETLARNGFQFWTGSTDELMKRIEAEWADTGAVPTLEHPICWFALKPSEPA